MKRHGDFRPLFIATLILFTSTKNNRHETVFRGLHEVGVVPPSRDGSPIKSMTGGGGVYKQDGC